MVFFGRRGSCSNHENNSHSQQSQSQQQSQRSRFMYPGQRTSQITTTTTRYNPDGSQVSRYCMQGVSTSSCSSHNRHYQCHRTPSSQTVSTATTTPTIDSSSSSRSSFCPLQHQQQQQQQQQQQRVVIQGSYSQSSPFPDILPGVQQQPTGLNNNNRSISEATTSSSTSTSSSHTQHPPPPTNQQGQNNNSTHHNSNNNNNINQMMQHTHLTEPTVRPGAYAVKRTTNGQPSQVFRVTVPNGVRPGTEFSVHAGSRRVRVRCPPTTGPGQVVQITLPPEPLTSQTLLRTAPLTMSNNNNNNNSGSNSSTANGGAVPMTDDVMRVNQLAKETGSTAETFLVTIPDNVYAGMTFTANVDGQRFMVTCPPNAGPGMTVRIVPPQRTPEQMCPEALPRTQVFEVLVPAGIKPNQAFTLMANGQRVLVTCPPNVYPGQKIRFELPIKQAAAGIKLNYEGNCGWSRTVRVSDMKFQWIRLNSGCHSNDNKDTKRNTTHNVSNNPALSDGAEEEQDENADLIDTENKFDFKKSAYVRKLQFLEGNDARMRTGTISLVPASEAVVDSRLVVQNKVLMSYADIASIQGKTLEEKSNWLEGICKELKGDWNSQNNNNGEGHIKICVRRRHLLDDAINSIMSLSRRDLRKFWRIEFIGEPAIDAGGITRDFFQQVTEQIFDPNKGLWKPSIQNQMCMTINPASHISCPDDHLIYFRFIGRMIGRALFDKQLISNHLVRHIYKHLLGWPITFSDLEHQDEDYYKNLKKLLTYDNIADMCMDFTVTEETLGVRTDVDLVDGGSERSVTNNNIDEYLEANLRYRMLNREKQQLTELLLGFFDVIPEPVLSVFDHQELELLLCGLPEIDVDDWKCNTKYTGLYQSRGRRHEVVEWFWDIVTNRFDQEMKARLLQFVTGTSGVPPAGFSVLQGNDGNIKKFTVHGVSTDVSVYPRAHTCFNRIDLPLYTTKDELEEKLRSAITMSAKTGFDME